MPPSTAPDTNPAQETRHCDVLIVGGGPGGSTAAAVLAKLGRNVVLLEKARHPRFHIGESLLPKNLDIFERLGVLDKVEALGIPKPGADFNAAHYEPNRHNFYFKNALDAKWPHAFEVRRSEFDEMLFRNAQAEGAKGLEETRVTGVEFQPDHSAIVTAKGPDGVLSWHTRRLIDASGRDTFLAGKFGLKRKNPRHASAALFGHFTGVERRPGENAGNISAYWFEHGWFWMIPLRDGTMSVGAVCDPEYLKTRKVSPAEFLQQTIAMAPEEMRARMAEAEPVPEFDVRATGNFSYQCTQMYGDGWLMVGDAFAFIDPIFSSGVLMAMTNAVEAAELTDAILDGKPGTAKCLRRYEKRVMKGIKTFSWFIERFNSPGLRHLFMNPGNPLRIEEAVTSVLAGDVYGNPRVDWRLQAFKLLYYFISAANWRETMQDVRRRSKRARSAFTGGTTEQDTA